MSPVDLAILALAALALLLGLYTGLLRVLLASLGLGAAVWCAWSYGAAVAGGLEGLMGSERAARVAAYVAIMVAVVAASAALTWVVTRGLKLFRLGWLDRLAGAAVGLVAVTALVAMLGVALDVDTRRGRNLGDSRLLPAAAGVWGRLWSPAARAPAAPESARQAGAP